MLANINRFGAIWSVGCGLLASALTAGAATGLPFRARYEPEAAVIALSPASRSALFRESDSITITTSAPATIRVLDLDGAVVYAGPPSTLHLKRGHYFVETDGDRNQFAVLPADYHGAEFMGVEADTGRNQPNTERIAQIAPGWVRAHGGGAGIFWDEVEPAPGVWNWELADRCIAANAPYQIIWSAFGRPAWQQDDSRFLPLFTEYVRQVARRYGDRLRAIEVWNEISWGTGGHFSRLPAHDNDDMAWLYFLMVQGARAAVKDVAPSIQIMGPAWSGWQTVDPARQRMLDWGIGKHLDWISWHDDLRRPPEGQTPSLSQNLAAAHALFPGQRVSIDEIYFWADSALGSPVADAAKLVDWRRGLGRAVKYTVIARTAEALLIPHVLAGEAWRQPNWGLYGWEFRGRGPQPKTSAFLMICYWLNRAQFVARSSLDSPITWYAWRRVSGELLVAAWCPEGKQAIFEPPAGTTVTDVFGRAQAGRTLGETPWLIQTTTPVDVSAMLARVRESLTSRRRP